MKIPNKTSQKRERRVRKDKCSTAYQIPVPQAVDLSDGTCSDDEFTITPRNPYTGQTVEEAVTEELAKPSVEEKRPKSTVRGCNIGQRPSRESMQRSHCFGRDGRNRIREWKWTRSSNPE